VQSVGRSWDDVEIARLFRSAVRASEPPLAEAAFAMSGLVRLAMVEGGFGTRAGGGGRAGDDSRRPSDVDMVGQLARLDELAAAVEVPTSFGVVRTLFESGRFRGDTLDYYDPRNSFLDDVLDRGVGIPITLSVLMIEVAARVGVELQGIGLPGHFVVGELDGVARIPARFFDPFHGGTVLDAEGCRELVSRLAGGPVAIPAEAWYPSSNASILDRMLNNQKAYWMGLTRTGDLSAATVLGAVMWARSCLPHVGDRERGEWMRAIAPLN
jgi:hypothetical protein